MKILLIGDIHLADKPPSSCTDEYLPELKAILEEAAALSHTEEVDATIFAGDIFHIKSPRRTTHELVAWFIGHLRTYNTVPYIVVGNHDIQYDRLETLPNQPLGVVFKSRTALPLGPTPVKAGSSEVLIAGIPYTEDMDVCDKWLHQAEGANLVVAHLPIMPDDRLVPFDVISHTSWWEQCRAPLTFHGHIHDDLGIEMNASHQQIACSGALSRGSLHESNLNRTIQFCIAEFDDGYGRFRFVKSEAAYPVERILKITDHTETKERIIDVQSFVDSIRDTSVRSRSLEAIIQEMMETDVEPAVIKMVAEILEEVR